MFMHRIGEQVMALPERELPVLKDRVTALTILEWAYDDADAARASPSLHAELRSQADATAWATDKKAWSIVYGLALKLWEIAYTAHKRQVERKLRDLF